MGFKVQDVLCIESRTKGVGFESSEFRVVSLASKSVCWVVEIMVATWSPLLFFRYPSLQPLNTTHQALHQLPYP